MLKTPLQVQSPKGGCLNWKGPKGPSPRGFGRVVVSWRGLGFLLGALDLYWGEGAFGPFQFKQAPLGLWTCSGVLSL